MVMNALVMERSLNAMKDMYLNLIEPNNNLKKRLRKIKMTIMMKMMNKITHQAHTYQALCHQALTQALVPPPLVLPPLVLPRILLFLNQLKNVAIIQPTRLGTRTSVQQDKNAQLQPITQLDVPSTFTIVACASSRRIVVPI